MLFSHSFDHNYEADDRCTILIDFGMEWIKKYDK